MASADIQPAAGLAQPAGINIRRVDLGLVLLIGFVPLVMSAVYQLFVPIPGTAPSTNLRMSTGLVHEVGALILFGTLLRRQGRRLQDIGIGWHWFDLPKAAGLFALSYTAMIFVSATLRSTHLFWTRSELQLRDPRVIFGGASPAVLILYFIAAPIFEETLVRGYLMTELIAFSCPVWVAAVASVVLQTSYHLYYGVEGALSVAAGFAISAAYFARSRNLMPVILSHFLWDLTATYLNWHR